MNLRTLALFTLLSAPMATPGCARPAAAPAPPAPSGPAAARAEAAARVPDPARGGPALLPGASPLPPFTGVSRDSARYVGGERCAGCHPLAAQVWAGSAHAQALFTLVAASRDADPGCRSCHVTGLGHEGGFSTPGQKPDLAHVQCEACHGPGSDHVAGPRAGYGQLPRALAACVACHNEDRAPDFIFTDAWARIAH